VQHDDVGAGSRPQRDAAVAVDPDPLVVGAVAEDDRPVLSVAAGDQTTGVSVERDADDDCSGVLNVDRSSNVSAMAASSSKPT
jgi:hypothetical protein